MKRILFGGHFFPYQVCTWLAVSTYNQYIFHTSNYRWFEYLAGFFVASIMIGLAEYVSHSIILHRLFRNHHQYHHDKPKRLSIIHVPFLVTIFQFFVYLFCLNCFLQEGIVCSWLGFFPLFYLSFEYIHFLAHTYPQDGENRFIRNAKFYHSLHHANKVSNYGFLSPTWDWLFGTLSPRYEVGFWELVLGIFPLISFLVRTRRNPET